MNKGSPPGNGKGASSQAPTANQQATDGDASADKQARQGFEDRRNSAACFKNDKRTEDWHADFVGVVTLEGWQDGDRAWVQVKQRLDRSGNVYITVTLKKMERRAR